MHELDLANTDIATVSCEPTTSASSCSPVSGKPLSNAVDTSVSTEWSDSAMGMLKIEFAKRENVCQFTFATGASLGETCVQWVLYGEHLGVQELLNEQLTDFPIPTDTLTYLPDINICDPQGECVGRTTCSDVGQECVDPDTTRANDWYCKCTVPQVGTSVTGGVASCVYDECNAQTSVCSAAGQLCADPSPSTMGDWQCVCPPSSVGVKATAGPATCTPTGSCASNSCSSTLPICTNTATSFRCDCPTNYIKDSITGACVVDYCAQFGHVCLAVGQVCSVLTSTNSSDTWQCECQGGAVGVGTAQRAYCIYKDECAQGNNGKLCSDAGQICHDPSSSVSGDWQCACASPTTGSNATAAVATCEYDECGVSGTACTASGQTCNDPVKTVASINDWVCSCSGSVGNVLSEVGAPAACVYTLDCTANSATCSSSGQACTDVDGQTDSNYVCQCLSPFSGSQTNAAASCTLDECLVNEKICTAQAQLCVDPSGAEGDWQCRCIGPASGTGVARAAVCTYAGDCAANSKTCTDVGQTCTDPSSLTGGDWQCTCVPPFQGTGSQGAATCTYDECTDNSDVCAAAGQVCKDAKLTTTGDFECFCAGSTTGSSAVAKPAVCAPTNPTGLCSTGVCTAAGQVCTETTSSFNCTCVPPAVGTAGLNSPATCTIDKCLSMGHLCEGAGQLCETVGTVSWKCTCQGNSTGEQVEGVARCEYAGECGDGISKTCTDVGQTCFDPDPATSGDWQCRCLDGQQGSPVTAGVASCTLNECLAQGEVCYAQGRDCQDTDTATAASGSWGCVAFSGLCTTEYRTCTNADQECVIPSGASSSEWVCSCRDNPTGGSTPNTAQQSSVADCVNAAAPPSTPAPDDDDDDLCWWCILLIVLGAILCCALCIFLALKMRKKPEEEEEKKGEEPEAPPVPVKGPEHNGTFYEDPEKDDPLLRTPPEGGAPLMPMPVSAGAEGTPFRPLMRNGGGRGQRTNPLAHYPNEAQDNTFVCSTFFRFTSISMESTCAKKPQKL